MIRVHNIETDEVIDREMTNEELEQYKKENAEIAARLKADKEKIQSRESALAKLAALGLTEDEIAAL